VDDIYTSLSDAELAARFDHGDGAALNVLCRRHYLPVFRYATTSPESPRGGGLHPGGLRPLRAELGHLAGPRSWAGPWLTVIVRNVVVDHWKRVGVLERHGAVPAVGGSADSDAGDELLERERLEAVETALERLGTPAGS